MKISDLVPEKSCNRSKEKVVASIKRKETGQTGGERGTLCDTVELMGQAER